jgi:membrane fusion protein (multidrug efflux system)
VPYDEDDRHATGDVETGEHQGRAEAPARGQRAAAPRQRRSPLRWIVLAVVAIAALVAGTTYWYATRNLETTDDAHTDGNAIVIAAKVAGYVTALAINDNMRVHAGQVLLRIDPRDYQAARDQAAGNVTAVEAQLADARAAAAIARVVAPAKLDEARAQQAAAQATLTRAEADLRRQLGLPPAATTRTTIDQVTAAAAEARAQLAEAEAAVRQAEPVAETIAEAAARVHELEGQLVQARAQRDQAEVNLSYCTLLAPQDGTVTRRNVNLGDYVAAGASLMSLVAPQVWVTANFKEDELDRMRPGQPVRIAVDAYPGLKLRGHVDSIQEGSGSRFSAFTAENATGNFVKIVQRVPVKIDIDAGLPADFPLPLGLSVEPTVRVK